MSECCASGMLFSESAVNIDEQYEEAFNERLTQLHSQLLALTKALKRKQEIDDVRKKIALLKAKKEEFEILRTEYYTTRDRYKKSRTVENSAAKRRARAEFEEVREQYNKLLGLGVKSILTLTNIFMAAAVSLLLVAVYLFQLEDLSRRVYGVSAASAICFCIALGVFGFRTPDWFAQSY